MMCQNNYSIARMENKNAEKYTEIQRDEVKYLFDILADNSTVNIAKVTGFKRGFVDKTITDYITKKYVN